LMEAEISEIVLPRYLDEAERKRTSSFKTIGKHSLLGPLILDSHGKQLVVNFESSLYDICFSSDAISHSKPVSFAPMTWEEGHDSLPHSILGSSSFQEDHGASKSILGQCFSFVFSAPLFCSTAPLLHCSTVWFPKDALAFRSISLKSMVCSHWTPTCPDDWWSCVLL